MRGLSRRGSLSFVLGLLLLTAGPAAAQGRGRLDFDNPVVQLVMQVQDVVTPDLMQNEDVIGTATGLVEGGRIGLLIFVNEESPTAMATMRQDFGPSFGGIPVQVLATSPFRAFKGGPPGGGGGGGGGGGVSHTALQAPPVQLGTSGGWRYDLANGFCCGGTLGALIQVGGTKRILSNYHVFEADIVNGGNGRRSQTGDPIIQPGLIDVGCNANNTQVVGNLVVTSSLPGSNVDCSTATANLELVDPNGSILEIGVPSSSTVGAAVGQAVKKSGRTTGLTRSAVSGLNATVSVAYENECAGGSAFTKTFTGQIIIDNKGTKFLGGGDSGSVMFEDVSNSPRAVGLLFAGSRSLAVANPINQVLSFLNASMVGN